jgi:Xaa-Pro dipeptidase
MTQKTLPERLALIVWPRDGEPTYIVCTLEELQAEAESWITDIRSYFEFKESPVGLLAEVIREKGLAKATIGIETDFLTVNYFEV